MPAAESHYLEPQSATVPFVAGLDKKSDPKAVPSPKLLDLKAASFFAPGEISKDRGYAQLNETLIDDTAITAVGNAYRIVGCNAQQLLFADLDCYQYIPGFDRYALLAPSRGCWATSSVETTGYNREKLSYHCDYAYLGGYELILTWGAGGVQYTFRDRSTGTVIWASTRTGQNATAYTIGTQFIGFVWLDGANVNVLKWNIASPNISPSSSTAANDALANTPLDCFPQSSTQLAIAFQQTASGKLKLLYRNIATLATSANVAVGATITSGLTISCDANGNTFVVWCDAGTGMHGAGFNAAIGGIGAAVMDAAVVAGIATAVVPYNGSWAVVYLDNATNVIDILVAASTGATVGKFVQLWGYTALTHRAITVCAHSGAFAFGAARVSGGPASPESYATTILCDPARPSELEPIAWYLHNLTGAPASGNSAKSNVQLVGNEYRWSVREVTSRTQAGTASWLETYAQSICAFRFDDGTAAPRASVVAFGGGVAQPCHPGTAVPGCMGLTAFPYAPTIVSVVDYNQGGGALVPGQSYQYVAVYEFIDDDGTRHQSAPSLPIAKVIGGGNNAVHVTVMTPYARRAHALSGTGAPYGVLTTVLYRTQGNGTTHTRTGTVGTSDDLDPGAAGRSVLNEYGSDASIAPNEALYTDSGELENSPTPHGRVLVLHQDRAWTIDEHSGELRYTKEIVEGQGFGWHPNLSIDLASNGIRGAALVSTNNGLWVFGTDTVTGAGAIQFLVGSGPSDNGIGSSYALQRLDGVTVSCQDQRHCAATPVGVLFYDPQQGFHLLSAQAAPAFVGAEAQKLVSGSVLGMHVMADRKEVRITLSSETLLVWHYDVQQWSRRLVAAPGGGELITTLVDACMWGGRHTLLWLDSSAQKPIVLQQTLAGYTDAVSTFYPLSLDTSWIKAASFKGMQRIWRITLLGRVVNFPAFEVSQRVTLWYDYDDSGAGQILDWAHTDWGDAIDAAGNVSIAIVPNKQLCESFKMRLEDTYPGGVTFGGGIAWTAMRIDYGVRRGRARQVDTAVKG